MPDDHVDKRPRPFCNKAGVGGWSRTRTLVVILNLSIAASFYLVPLTLGYAWNNSAGPSILNVTHQDRRYPATNITAEPWGASVVLGPAESRLREYFSGRHLPLWNPYQGLGEPYAAQADGSPYSLPTLARALVPPWAGNIITFGVFAIGAAGMLAFLGMIGLSKEIRFFGALAVFLSTALTFHIARYNIADQNALIPVQFAVMTWAIQRRRPLTYLALAAVTAITITAGFVQSAVITVVITSLFGVALIWLTLESGREKALVVSAIIAATLAGVALSAPFWLPTAELVEVGYHKNVPSIVVYRPPPYNLAAFFFPALFGDALAFTSMGGAGPFVNWGNLFATSSAVVLLLCLIGLFACNWEDRRHRLLFWLALVCIAVLVLRFMHWPPFSFLSRDTVLAQQATKHTQAIAAFLALLAAMLTLEHHKNWVDARLKWVCGGFLFIPVAVLCAAGIRSADPVGLLASLRYLPTVLLTAGAAALFAMFRRPLGSFFITMVGVVICAELSLYLPLGTKLSYILDARLGLCIAWVAACWLILTGKRTIGGVLAALMILGYSAIIALPKNGLPNQVHTRALPAFAEFLRARVGSDYRSFGIFPNFSSQARIQDVGVVGPFATSGFAAFIHSIDPAGKLGFYGSSVFLLAGAGWRLDLNSYSRYRPIFDWLGVRYLVVEKAMLGSNAQAFANHEDTASVRTVYDDRDVTILESLTAKRRFEFSSSPMILRSQSAIIRVLQSDPSIVNRSILLESSAADKFLESVEASAEASAGNAEIVILDENPNYLRLKLNNSRNGIIVVKDSDFPGWEATVDGGKAPILRVNGMVRGVEIASPGMHIVEFRYHPLSFWYGAFVGAVVLTLFVLLLFLPASNPRVTEARLVPFLLICASAVASAPAIVIPAESATLRLGRHERAIAIDLRNLVLKWRETDSRDNQELFTRAVRFARLPVAVLGERDIPLHIGDLVYLANIGVTEIDSRGGFREVAAAEGTIVPLCRLFETADKKDDGAARYEQGRWQIIAQGGSASSPRCMQADNIGR
jgi:hypothetical protein